MTVIECPQCHGSDMAETTEFGTACPRCGGQGFVFVKQTELNVVGGGDAEMKGETGNSNAEPDRAVTREDEEEDSRRREEEVEEDMEEDNKQEAGNYKG